MSMEVDLMGRRGRGHRFFLRGGGGVVVVRCRGFKEEKSPDFRFPEVGISATVSMNAPPPPPSRAFDTILPNQFIKGMQLFYFYNLSYVNDK